MAVRADKRYVRTAAAQYGLGLITIMPGGKIHEEDSETANGKEKLLDGIACDLETLPTIGSSYNTITKMHLRSNALTSLPSLPPLLQYLDCGENMMRRLPSKLPVTLTSLLIDGNEFESLTVDTDVPIAILHCHNNPKLIRLPTTLGATLTSLWCSTAQIRATLLRGHTARKLDLAIFSGNTRLSRDIDVHIQNSIAEKTQDFVSGRPAVTFGKVTHTYYVLYRAFFLQYCDEKKYEVDEEKLHREWREELEKKKEQQAAVLLRSLHQYGYSKHAAKQ